MDEFLLSINSEKFRSTNQLWNSLMLNDPWSVGYVTSLIVVEEFHTKEDWEHFYYQSGKERDKLVERTGIDTASLLNNEQLIRLDPGKVRQLSWDLKNLNFQYGRTEDQLRKKGGVLKEAVSTNGLILTDEEAFQCVRFRVICETWNGVILRELNTIATLKRLLPEAEFRKVDGEFDHKYAVDYQVFKKNVLVYGLQIKPESYTRNAPYINKARFANQQKNSHYTAEFGVPVYDIIAGSNGYIVNQDVIKNL